MALNIPSISFPTRTICLIFHPLKDFENPNTLAYEKHPNNIFLTKYDFVNYDHL
jgi:hypothetical protein